MTTKPFPLTRWRALKQADFTSGAACQILISSLTYCRLKRYEFLPVSMGTTMFNCWFNERSQSTEIVLYCTVCLVLGGCMHIIYDNIGTLQNCKTSIALCQSSRNEVMYSNFDYDSLWDYCIPMILKYLRPLETPEGVHNEKPVHYRKPRICGYPCMGAMWDSIWIKKSNSYRYL